MILAQEQTALKAESLDATFDALRSFVLQAAHEGTPIHLVERGLWTRVLALGLEALKAFLHLQGTGDLGPTVTLPDGHEVERLEPLHQRDYRSVFGEVSLARTAYGSRAGQKIEFVPLDQRLQLPAGDYSYLLQDWDQMFGVEESFGRVRELILKVLGLKQPVDSLERMNRHMAQDVEGFRQSRPAPKPAEEGAVFVASGDGKGVPMRRSAANRPAMATIHGHRKKGQKAKRKKMAIVGTVYSVDRHVRTPEQVVEALFRAPEAPAQARPQRPRPCHKHLWASLTFDTQGRHHDGMADVFGWMAQELQRRNPGGAKETVHLMDGQEALWEARRDHLPCHHSVPILELLHVTPRLWEAAHVFHQEGGDEAAAFVRERLLRVLRGQVRWVIAGLRQMATKRAVSAARHRTIDRICDYFQANEHRMRYHEYLAKGYPIASGVIEGACRHYVKDRMERAGMHWTFPGAQAMLDLRSVYLNGDWEAYQNYRITQENRRLYPHAEILQEVPWPMAA